jgi:RNA polymerase sigma-70 factor (ECF subfamily)
MTDESDQTEDLMRRAGAGDAAAQGELFSHYRDRLRRMIWLRMDRRMNGRVDVSDVLQDAFVEFSRALPSYLTEPSMPFYLWLRTIVGRQLRASHRRHLGAAMRDAGRDVSLHGHNVPEATSISLAELLLGKQTSPSQAMMRIELQARVQAALESIDAIDREVLALRHFEQLSNSETARALELSESAASNRYVRALMRIRTLLADVPGLLDGQIE